MKNKLEKRVEEMAVKYGIPMADFESLIIEIKEKAYNEGLSNAEKVAREDIKENYKPSNNI